MLCHLDSHEQAAIRPTHDAQAGRRGNLPADEVLSYGGEIVINDLAVGLQSSFMPRRTELATAANVRQYVDAALLQPQFARDGVVSRRTRGFETAIRRQQRRIRAVKLHALRVHDEVGDLRAVL